MVNAEMIRAGEIRKGQVLHFMGRTNSDGTPERWRVTSIKLWKRDQNRFRLGLSRGLYQHDSIDESDASLAKFEAA